VYDSQSDTDALQIQKLQEVKTAELLQHDDSAFLALLTVSLRKCREYLMTRE